MADDKRVSIATWDVDRVASWMTDAGFGNYATVFEEQEIDGDALTSLDHDSLLDMGLTDEDLPSFVSTLTELHEFYGIEPEAPIIVDHLAAQAEAATAAAEAKGKGKNQAKKDKKKKKVTDDPVGTGGAGDDGAATAGSASSEDRASDDDGDDVPGDDGGSDDDAERRRRRAKSVLGKTNRELIWIEYFNDDGVPYYYNALREETVWEAPDEGLIVRRKSQQGNEANDSARPHHKGEIKTAVNGKGWKARFVMVVDMVLYVFKSEKAVLKKKAPLITVPLPGYHVDFAHAEFKKHPFSFSLSHANCDTLHFSARSDEERREWMNTLHDMGLLVKAGHYRRADAFVLTETPYDDGEGLEIRALPAAEAAATMEGVDAVDEASDITSPFDPAMRYRYPARSRIGGVDQSVVLEIGPRFVQLFDATTYRSVSTHRWSWIRMYRFEVRPADHSSFLHILDESPKGGRRIFSFEFDCVPLKEHCEERLAAHVAGVVARHAARKEARAAAGRRSGAGADGDKTKKKGKKKDKKKKKKKKKIKPRALIASKGRVRNLLAVDSADASNDDSSAAPPATPVSRPPQLSTMPEEADDDGGDGGPVGDTSGSDGGEDDGGNSKRLSILGPSRNLLFSPTMTDETDFDAAAGKSGNASPPSGDGRDGPPDSPSKRKLF